MRLLITGAAGYVGRRLVRGLATEHDLRPGIRAGPAASPSEPLAFRKARAAP